MSTTAAAPRTRRAPASRPRPVARPAAQPVRQPARAPFVVAVLMLLTLGLGALLLLNTLLAQGSFALHSLEAQVADLADREQELRQRAAELAAPQRLERRAREMGMVPSGNPAFLRSQDGKVLGVPIPATAPVPVVGSSTTESDDGADEEANSARDRDAQNQQNQQQGQAQNQQQGQAQNQQDGGGTG